MPENRPLKRPRDPAQLAKLMIDIASGEIEGRPLTPEEQRKNPILIVLFGVFPTTAVGTDLLFAAATKTVGSLYTALTERLPGKSCDGLPVVAYRQKPSP